MLLQKASQMLFDLNQAIQNKHQGTFGLLEGIPLVPKTLPKFKIQQLILQKTLLGIWIAYAEEKGKNIKEKEAIT